MCQKRHGMRKDVKVRDVARLRVQYFNKIMEEIGKDNPTLTKSQLRTKVKQQIKEIVLDVVESFAGKTERAERMKEIMRRYVATKEREAEGDEGGLVVPGGAVFADPSQADHVQWLHSVSENVSRFFLCRNNPCTPGKGQYYGLNTDWISTCHAGGWQFACPSCGAWYKAGASSTSNIPAHFVFWLEAKGEGMLSEWAAGAEENAIVEFQAALAEETLGDLRQLPTGELMAKLALFVKQHRVPAHFQEMQLSPSVKSYIDGQNAQRSKRKPWSYSHLEGGFRGTFFEYKEGVTPVMSAEDTKSFLAMIKVLIDKM
jgi:hypothetical protein